MGVYDIFLREMNGQVEMRSERSHLRDYKKYGVLLGMFGFVFLLLVISAYAHGTWGHTTHRVFLEEWKNTEQAKYYVGGSNHPYIGSWDKDNRYGGYIDGKKEWKWDWLHTGYYVPTKFTAKVHFEPNPYSTSIRSENSPNGRAPKGGLVLGSIGVQIGPWSVGIPTFDYISYSYQSSTLTGSWVDYRSYAASLLNDDFAFWQAMYPYSDTYNHNQKVVIHTSVTRTGFNDIPGVGFVPVGSDCSSATFVLGDNTGNDDGYIDPVWKD